MVACTTLGLYTSTVSVLQIKSVIPNQSHNLMMVPKLPGSRTLSKATFKPFLDGWLTSFILKSAKQSLGVVKRDIFFSSTSEISVINALETSNFSFLEV